MSQYVVVIETYTVQPVIAWNITASRLVKSSQIVQPLSDQHRRYWIGISSDPEGARASFARTYPFAFYRVIHAIRAENRSEMLYDALRMKFQPDHIVHSWYHLTPSDLQWLRSITDENMAQMIPQIENALAKENGVEVRDVTRRHGRNVKTCIIDEMPPQMTVEELQEMKRKLIEQANELLGVS